MGLPEQEIAREVERRVRAAEGRCADTDSARVRRLEAEVRLLVLFATGVLSELRLPTVRSTESGDLDVAALFSVLGRFHAAASDARLALARAEGELVGLR